MKRTRGLGFAFQRGSVWWIQYNVRGKRHRESSGSTNRADAIRMLKKKIADVAAGKPVGLQVEKTTLKEIAGMVLDDYRANERRSVDRVEGAISHLYEFFGAEAPAVTITSDRLTAYQAYRQESLYTGKLI
ncbi:MAG TPA: hypothetical protein VJX23_13040 [Candidatus Binataceae bacterium]|nr:hypothetical protein [Candidatus Binataceae bacterium]